MEAEPESGSVNENKPLIVFLFFRRLAQNKKQMAEEMNDLEKKLHKERKDREAKVAKVRQLETELREIKSDVGQKSEIGK